MNQTLVLLHGWGGSKNSLEELDSKLRSFGYSTLRLEMPGHGKTPTMQNPWNMKDFCMWVKDELNRKNINDYILIGHSFGGRIIIDGVINEFLHPQKIVLIDSSGIRPKNSLKKTFWKTASKLPGIKILISPFKSLIYKYIIREKDYANTKGQLKETFKIINEAYYNEKVSRISLPTLIIWGKDDSVTPLWMGQQLHEKIAHSQLIVLEGTHSLPIKNTKEVAQVIHRFI